MYNADEGIWWSEGWGWLCVDLGVVGWVVYYLVIRYCTTHVEEKLNEKFLGGCVLGFGVAIGRVSYLVVLGVRLITVLGVSVIDYTCTF